MKTLVEDGRWLPTLGGMIHCEMDREQLTRHVKELAERYETPLPEVASRVEELEARVSGHLERMGFEA